MARTTNLIAALVTAKDEAGLSALKAEVTTRSECRWTPQMFDAKVADIRKHGVKIQAPKAKTPKVKVPMFTQERTELEPKTTLVRVEGPIFAGLYPLTINGGLMTTRRDGQTFAGLTGTLCGESVRLAVAQQGEEPKCADRLAEGKVVSIWLGGKVNGRRHTMQVEA